MWRPSASKRSNPAATNVLAVTPRSSVRASPHSEPTRTRRTRLPAEGGAVGARVGGADEPVGVETDHLRVAHEVAPVLDDLHVVPAAAQLVGDAGREAPFQAQRARHVAPRAT